ncbi:MAG: hypothetical protein CVU81_02135 [Euryarchaeota archaeon HGW-Euryarchaeota-1]|nr:MAG: hypothetical protein CVU81_02135 [Euryarchaeota archaeon HGW-Euryarchaeota-1]
MAAKIAIALGMKVRKNVMFMRKIIVDGSNVSGFQRTALLATDGKIKTSFGEIEISNLFVEEDAAQIVGEEDGKRVFSLHRLGIPLVEITTKMFSATSEQVKEIAEIIGSVLRMTGFARRGIGTIRQDINLSIGDGKRVEIKGAQDLSLMEKIIKLEIDRQKKLKNNLKSEVRQVLADGTTKALRPISGGARMYPETDIPVFTFTNEELKEIQKYNLVGVEEKLKRFKSLNLSDDFANQILKSRDLFDFEDAITKLKNIEPKKIAEVFLNVKKDAQRQLGKEITNAAVFEVLELLNNDKLVFSAIIEILTGKDPKNFAVLKGTSLEDAIKSIAEKNKEKDENAMIKVLMSELRLVADARDVLRIYKNLK